ncbi:hypothetical protein GJ496_009622 [Pomphorhynchus laevis]|nr:hypothetical protein GJ496_009622 [Pomphorhynchus laevis]
MSEDFNGSKQIKMTPSSLSSLTTTIYSSSNSNFAYSNDSSMSNNDNCSINDNHRTTNSGASKLLLSSGQLKIIDGRWSKTGDTDEQQNEPNQQCCRCRQGCGIHGFDSRRSGSMPRCQSASNPLALTTTTISDIVDSNKRNEENEAKRLKEIRRARLNKCKEDIDEILTGKSKKMFEKYNEIDDMFARNVQQTRHTLSTDRVDLQKQLDHVKTIKRAKLRAASSQRTGLSVDWLQSIRKLQSKELTNSVDRIDHDMLNTLLQVYDNDKPSHAPTREFDGAASSHQTFTDLGSSRSLLPASLNIENNTNKSNANNTSSSPTSLTTSAKTDIQINNTISNNNNVNDDPQCSIFRGLDRRIDISDTANLNQPIRLSTHLMRSLNSTSSNQILLNCTRRKVRNYLFRMSIAEYSYKQKMEDKCNKRPVRNAHRISWQTTPIPLTCRKSLDISAPREKVIQDLQSMSIPKSQWGFSDGKNGKSLNTSTRRARLPSISAAASSSATSNNDDCIRDYLHQQPQQHSTANTENNPVNMAELYPLGSEVFVEFGLTDSFTGIVTQVNNFGINVQFGERGDKIAINTSALVDKRVVVHVFECVSPLPDMPNNQDFNDSAHQISYNHGRGKRRSRRGISSYSHRHGRR